MNAYARKGRRADLELVADGSWAKIGRKHYRHVSGIEIVYRPNQWNWEIIGGREDGHRYSTLTVAAHSAIR